MFRGKARALLVAFTVQIQGEAFRAEVDAEPSRGETAGPLRQTVRGSRGTAAEFTFRLQLGRRDQAISMMVKVYRPGSGLQVWHVVVDLSGRVLHQHTKWEAG